METFSLLLATNVLNTVSQLTEGFFGGRECFLEGMGLANNIGISSRIVWVACFALRLPTSSVQGSSLPHRSS